METHATRSNTSLTNENDGKILLLTSNRKLRIHIGDTTLEMMNIVMPWEFKVKDKIISNNSYVPKYQINSLSMRSAMSCIK